MTGLKEFTEDVMQQIKDYLPEEYQNVECTVENREKNNGIIRRGLSLSQPGERISPIIYMEPFYEKIQRGVSMSLVMPEIANMCEMSMKNMSKIQILDLTSYEEAKEHMTVKMVNTRANQRMLRELPHKELEDLSVFCQIELPSSSDDHSETINVTHEIIERWGVDQDVVIKGALESAEKKHPPVMIAMQDALEWCMGNQKEEFNLLETGSAQELDINGMFVLSNQVKVHGAAVLTYPGMSEKLNELFPDGFYVIPSSIHEILIVSQKLEISPKQLGEMVREVNRTAVSREDILSDRVYQFDKDKGRICQVSESIEKARGMER